MGIKSSLSTKKDVLLFFGGLLYAIGHVLFALVFVKYKTAIFPSLREFEWVCTYLIAPFCFTGILVYTIGAVVDYSEQKQESKETAADSVFIYFFIPAWFSVLSFCAAAVLLFIKEGMKNNSAFNLGVVVTIVFALCQLYHIDKYTGFLFFRQAETPKESSYRLYIKKSYAWFVFGGLWCPYIIARFLSVWFAPWRPFLHRSYDNMTSKRIYWGCCVLGSLVFLYVWFDTLVIYSVLLGAMTGRVVAYILCPILDMPTERQAKKISPQQQTLIYNALAALKGTVFIFDAPVLSNPSDLLSTTPLTIFELLDIILVENVIKGISVFADGAYNNNICDNIEKWRQHGILYTDSGNSIYTQIDNTICHYGSSTTYIVFARDRNACLDIERWMITNHEKVLHFTGTVQETLQRLCNCNK